MTVPYIFVYGNSVHILKPRFFVLTIHPEKTKKLTYGAPGYGAPGFGEDDCP